jgi:hypothetical protein
LRRPGRKKEVAKKQVYCPRNSGFIQAGAYSIEESQVYKFKRLVLAATTLAMFTISSHAVYAEKGTVSAMAPWQGEGQIYQVGPERAMFLGAFSGIMYVQTGKESLDALLMLCPATQTLNLENGATESRGFCTFEGPSGDRVFAEWKCTGKRGGCKGVITLTGGTGRFKGISGGGDMVARSVLNKLAANLESGSVVRSAAGLVVWNELSYSIPE